MKPATKSDWRTKPLPRKRATISIQGSFSAREMVRITIGLIPQQMEDKWFIYFDSGQLYFYRSWTGFCIYIVSFKAEGSRYSMSQAIVNRAPKQYGQASEEYDRRLISYLIDVLLLGRQAEFPNANKLPVESAAIQQWSAAGRVMLRKHKDLVGAITYLESKGDRQVPMSGKKTKLKLEHSQLGFKTFTGKNGTRYLVFLTENGSFHAFAEVEAKEAARACGASEANTRKMWKSLWDNGA